jgi:hypothetical protein
MPATPNVLQWDGSPGHYEVYYLTFTVPGGLGAWLRYTMLAPLEGEATCALWAATMDPETGEVRGHKDTFPIGELRAEPEPFRLRVGPGELTDSSATGRAGDVAWDLAWAPGRAYEPVHPVLRRARVAQTILTLPHGDVELRGTITVGGQTVTVDGARAGQAHLWGSKHARRWAWMHGGDLRGADGSTRPGDFLDAVSVVVPRFGREVGPSTPVVGRFGGEDFRSTSPARVLTNESRFGLTSWHFEAVDGRRRVVVEVDAPRDGLVGVTYHDPDGDEAYCYNSEIATTRVWVYERERRGPWVLRDTLVGDGCAHFEYAQRRPVPGFELAVR